MEEIIRIGPQPGFQTQFLSSPADIVIGGGSAGGGKTHALLLESIRYYDIPDMTGVIFRRTYPQIMLEGGLWDKANEVYPYFNGKSNQAYMRWEFPEGATISFRHLQHEKNLLDYQGSEIAFIGFDELTHFTKRMFFYMLSRNRSTVGIRPYIRATCNPDPNSWVADFISWWVDEETGFPIPERCGKVRYFTQDSDIVIWGDSVEEVRDKAGHLFKDERLKDIQLSDLIKSCTFIPGTVYDNKELIEKNPAYLGNLLALDEDEKTRLLHGNWRITMDGTMLADYARVNHIFDEPAFTQKGHYITCDAARFGRDLATVAVWRGWDLFFLHILTKSEVSDIFEIIEHQRKKYKIPRWNVLVDQDGVGGGVVKMGRYSGFQGGMQPIYTRETRMRESYANLKAQCFFRFFEENLNTGDMSVSLTSETCIVNGIRGLKVKIGSNVIDVRDLIRKDLRSYRRKELPDDVQKRALMPKEEQKELLGGRSPDLGDTICMRKWFDVFPQKPGLKRY